MALPSDPDYIPACTNQRVLALPLYQWLLAHNWDPYAEHSWDAGMVQNLEETAA